jgi:hypothetical protein
MASALGIAIALFSNKRKGKVMIDFDNFKKSFFLSRLVWLELPQELKSSGTVSRLLNSCDVDESSVWDLSPEQFINLFNRGFDSALLSNFDVVRVCWASLQDQEQILKLAKSIEKFQSFRVGLGLRLILVSSEVDELLLSYLHPLNPVVFNLGGRMGPGDLNLRVHRFLELASIHANVKVNRISEKAAFFLEESLRQEVDEDFMALLILGLKRSQGKVLRFRDILPNFSGYFPPEEGRETL